MRQARHEGGIIQALVRGQRHQTKSHGQGDQPEDTKAAFRLGQQLQQGAPHAAGKECPAKALNNDGQTKSAEKKGVIEFHGFLVTENPPFVKERIMAAHTALHKGTGLTCGKNPAGALCPVLRPASSSQRQ